MKRILTVDGGLRRNVNAAVLCNTPISAFLKTAVVLICCGAMLASCSTGDRPTTIPSTNTTETTAMTIHDFTAKARKGATLDLSTLKGKVLLIVNTATGCGFTPQYEGLEKLYKAYHDKGLEILDFPCNQFGHQAPGDDAEIHAFCTAKYKTTFDQLAKIEVNGPGADPIFQFLKAAKPEDDDPPEDTAALRELLQKHGLAPEREPGLIEWNFTKFLVDRTGAVVKRSGPKTEPAALAPCIEALLGP